jgi:galactose mutarotase-like enzyme
MIVTIANDRFRAKLSSLGAELQSLVELKTGTEYMWQADPTWWKGTAPVLFPIVGGLKGNKYRFEGKEYELNPHGFAKFSEFSLAASTGRSADFELVSGPETRVKYPFEFKLRVSFAIEQDGVSVRYTVTNEGKAPMYFSIGSHPAFNVPFAGGELEDYHFEFEKDETVKRYFYTDGVVELGRTAEALEASRRVKLDKTVFDEGCLIFKAPTSRKFSLANRLNSRRITMVTEGAPFLGVWAKPNRAPFVCIEPWDGIPDPADTTGELTKKEGINRLEPRASFKSGYRVEIA